MTHIAALGCTNTDPAAHGGKAPRREEAVTGGEFRTIPGRRRGASASMPYRCEIETRYTS